MTTEADPWTPFETRSRTCTDCGTRSEELPDPESFMNWPETHVCNRKDAAA